MQLRNFLNAKKHATVIFLPQNESQI